MPPNQTLIIDLVHVHIQWCQNRYLFNTIVPIFKTIMSYILVYTKINVYEQWSWTVSNPSQKTSSIKESMFSASLTIRSSSPINPPIWSSTRGISSPSPMSNNSLAYSASPLTNYFIMLDISI